MYEIKKLNKKKQKMLKKEIKSFSGDSYIFSAEEISLMNEHEVRAVKNYIEQLIPGCKIIIVLAVRNYLKFIESAIQENVKSMRYFEYLIENKLKINEMYKSKLKKFEDIFNDVIIYKYEDSLSHPKGPCGYFLEKVGFSQLDDIEVLNDNIGLDMFALELISYINRFIPFYHNTFKSKYRSENDTTLIYKLKGKGKFKIPDNRFEEYKVKATLEHRWLKEHFDIDYLEDVYDRDSSYADYDVSYKKTFLSIIKEVNPTIRLGMYNFAKNKVQDSKVFEEIIIEIEKEFKKDDLDHYFSILDKYYNEISLSESKQYNNAFLVRLYRKLFRR
jgi:hypothetical protein